MTPEQYAERRLQILEQVTRDLMLVLLNAHPMAGEFVNQIGCKWDAALDRLDSERAWANAAQCAAMSSVTADNNQEKKNV